MHRRFLADVQVGKEETEGFHQADEILEFAMGDDGVAVADEGITDPIQIGQQALFVGIAVVRFGQGTVFQMVIETGQIVFDAPLHQRQFAAIGFLRIAMWPLGKDLGHGLFVPGQGVEKVRRGLNELGGHGQDLLQTADAAEVFPEHFPGLHARSGGRGLRFDEGVAISIAPDPGTEADETGNVNGVTVYPVGPIDGAFQVAVGLRHRLEQAFAEVVQAVPDFVDDLQAGGAHLVGLVEDANVPLQPFENPAPLDT